MGAGSAPIPAAANELAPSRPKNRLRVVLFGFIVSPFRK